MVPEPHSLNVIISEDDPDDQYLFRSALSEAGPGLSVQFVLTGDQLIRQLLRDVLSRGGSLGKPDLIIADLKKPFFWFDSLREIRIYTQFSEIPVHLFSMSGTPELEQAALNHGATGFYQKPYTFNELRKIVRDIVRGLRY